MAPFVRHWWHISHPLRCLLRFRRYVSALKLQYTADCIASAIAFAGGSDASRPFSQRLPAMRSSSGWARGGGGGGGGAWTTVCFRAARLPPPRFPPNVRRATSQRTGCICLSSFRLLLGVFAAHDPAAVNPRFNGAPNLHCILCQVKTGDGIAVFPSSKNCNWVECMW